MRNIEELRRTDRGRAESGSDGGPLRPSIDPMLLASIAGLRLPALLVDVRPPGDAILLASRSMLDLTGYSMDELAGESCEILCGPSPETVAVARIIEALRGPGDVAAELRGQRKDGAPFTATLCVTSVPADGANRPVYRLACLCDYRCCATAEIAPGGELAESGRGSFALDLLRTRMRLVALERELGEATETAKRREAEAAAADQALEAVLSVISDGFLLLDHDGRLVRVNAQAAERWGMSPRKMIGRRMWELFPEMVGSRFHQATLQAVVQRTAMEAEYYDRPLDRWFAYRIASSADGLVLLQTDITVEKATERRQRLLTAELQHRVKNNLALIRSLATRTLRRADSLEGFAEAFDGRLHALAVAQALLSRGAVEEVDLLELLLEELLPFGAQEGESLRVDGPKVMLRPKTAQLLGLVFHELATNAVRHGALAGREGRIEVVWAVAPDPGGDWLEWRWTERAARDLGPPGPPGLGRELVERGVPYQLGGSSRFVWGGDGIRCEIRVPLVEAVGKLRLSDPLPR